MAEQTSTVVVPTWYATSVARVGYSFSKTPVPPRTSAATTRRRAAFSPLLFFNNVLYIRQTELGIICGSWFTREQGPVTPGTTYACPRPSFPLPSSSASSDLPTYLPTYPRGVSMNAALRPQALRSTCFTSRRLPFQGVSRWLCTGTWRCVCGCVGVWVCGCVGGCGCVCLFF